jgi:transcription elongation GreA/GreB family factor
VGALAIGRVAIGRARIKRLRERLGGAVVVDSSSDVESFAFGRTAEVVDETSGKQGQYGRLPNESSP